MEKFFMVDGLQSLMFFYQEVEPVERGMVTVLDVNIKYDINPVRASATAEWVSCN